MSWQKLLKPDKDSYQLYARYHNYQILGMQLGCDLTYPDKIEIFTTLN